MSKAATLDNNYRQALQIVGGRQPRGNRPNQGNRQFNFGQYANQRTQRDPNAMDIDALTPERRQEFLRKGLCYNCQERGHIARECPKPHRKYSPNASQPSTSSTTTTTKRNGKELARYIRTLVDDLSPEEISIFQTSCTEEGF